MNEIIESIMKKYNLSIDEEFWMILHSGKLRNKYRFDKDGNLLYVATGCRDDFTLGQLARGEYEVAKIPFKPKYGDKYYYVAFVRGSDTSYPEISDEDTIWTDNHFDFLNLRAGNVFRTHGEAESNKYKIYRNLTGEEWKELK